MGPPFTYQDIPIAHLPMLLIMKYVALTFKCNFHWKAHCTEQTPFTTVFQSGTHLSGESYHT